MLDLAVHSKCGRRGGASPSPTDSLLQLDKLECEHKNPCRSFCSRELFYGLKASGASSESPKWCKIAWAILGQALPSP